MALPLQPDLEVLHQASAGDLAAIDLLHVDVLGTEEPRHQHLQVAQEIAVNLWMARPNGERVSAGETKWEVSVRRRQAVGHRRPYPRPCS